MGGGGGGGGGGGRGGGGWRWEVPSRISKYHTFFRQILVENGLILMALANKSKKTVCGESNERSCAGFKFHPPIEEKLEKTFWFLLRK